MADRPTLDVCNPDLPLTDWPSPLNNQPIKNTRRLQWSRDLRHELLSPAGILRGVSSNSTTGMEVCVRKFESSESGKLNKRAENEKFSPSQSAIRFHPEGGRSSSFSYTLFHHRSVPRHIGLCCEMLQLKFRISVPFPSHLHSSWFKWRVQ
jgi:hypothetical protein